MSAPANLRRAVALVRTGTPHPDWAVIGGRPIYQFWHMLSPHFRDVLLPPQRRSDGGGFSWSWRDAGAAGPPTGAELAEVRRRLKLAEQSFTATTTAPPWQHDPDDAGGPGSLGAKVKAGAQAMVLQFTGASDAVLADFVCRTESGPMIHSWGARVPATPCFVDALECEIGGAVLLGDESGAGLELVLENRAGAIIAQTRTDAAGLFLFRRIPGGDYRIRVEHRGDFPTTGFSVSVEQDSIYGLELRRGAAVATFSRVHSRAPFGSGTPVDVFSHVPFPPRRRSRRPLLIGVLALSAGAGLGWFWFIGPSGGGRVGPAAPSWQAADGATVAGPTGERSSGPGAVGAGGGGSQVSRASSGRTSGERVPPGGKPAARRAMPPAEKSAGASPADVPDGPRPARPSGRTLKSGAANGANPGLGPAAGPAGDRDAATEDAAADQREAGTEPADKFEGGLRGARTKGRRSAKAPTSGVPVGANSAAADHGQADAAPDRAEIAPEPADSPGKSGEVPSRPGTRARPGTGAAGGAARPDAAGGAGAAPFGSSAEAGGGGGSPAGPGQAARAGASRGGGAGPALRAAGKSATSAGGDGATATGAEAGNAADGSRTRSGPVATLTRAKPAGHAGGVSPGAGEDPAEATEPATDLTDAAARAAEGKTTKAAAGSGASASRSAAAATRGDATGTPSDAADGPAPSAVASPRAAPPRRGQKSDTERGVGDGPTVAGPVRDAGAASDEPALPQRHRLALADGGLRLLRDAILPTVPTPVGRTEPIESLRRRLRDEQEGRIPPGFRPAATARGVALDLPTGVWPAGGPPHWVEADGTAPAGASVQGGRAELTWSGRNAVTAGEWRLVRPDGSELAHVALEPGGVVTVRAIPAVRASVWVGVEGVTGAALPGATTALEWRTWEGVAVPPAWRRSDRWSGGRGARLELPLVAGGGIPQPVALVDPLSGWAVTFEVRRR